MTETIRALQFDHAASDASATRVASIARPRPRAGHVAIEVAFAGVNFKDVMCRRGDPGYVGAWPYVPGLEVAGTVREIGEGVSDLSVGQNVVALTNDGGLAEVAVATAALTVPVPAGLDLRAAAAAPGAPVTADLLLGLSHFAAGESLLVHSAAGAVGAAAAQLAHRAGANVIIGTVGSPSRRDRALTHGYDRVVVRGPQVLPELRAASDRGFDVILDPQGTTMVDVDLALAATGARILIFGNASGSTPEPLPPLPRLLAGNASIGAFSLKSLSTTTPGRVQASMRRILDLLAEDALTTPITYVDGLESAADAQQALAEGRGAIKYVVTLSQSSSSDATVSAA